MERQNFKRLLVACEKLVGDRSKAASARLQAYWPELNRLWDLYKRRSPHKREKLAAYEKRVAVIAVRGLEDFSTYGPAALAKSSSSASTGSGGSDSGSGGKKESEEESDRILEAEAEEMAEMARALKEANLRIRKTIREDTVVVEKIEDAVASNISKLRLQSGRLGQTISSRGFMHLLRLLALVVLAFVMYFFVYLFIRIMPRRR